MPARIAFLIALSAASLAAESARDRAERAESEMAFAEALEAYSEAVRLAPDAAFSARAEMRIDALRAHSEGGFAPLVQLETIRRSPALAVDGGAIDALVRAADTFPPGLVQVEAWSLAAEAYAHRLERPGDAVALWRRVAAAPSADRVLRDSAARSLVAYDLTRHDFAAARSAAASDPILSGDVRRASRRHDVHWAAIASLVLVGAGTALALGEAARAGRLRTVVTSARRSLRVILAYALYVAIAGAGLAIGYAAGTAKPFLLYGLTLAPLLVIARLWGSAGSPRPGARAARAALCFLSALGTAFLVVESVNAEYLRGVGL